MPASISAAEDLVRSCATLGIRYLFVNLGSDHPAFIEAFARLTHEQGGAGSLPEIIVCPHEMVALSVAHGYAMVTREAQAVLVHVDVGTQNLGGSVHNAARGRIPAIIIAGLSPVTEGPLRVGSRNEFIHYLQDAPRQHEIVGQYVKWAYEIRAPEMAAPVLQRAQQIATTSPEGPVYITGAREIWEDASVVASQSVAAWAPPIMGGLPPDDVAAMVEAIQSSQRPLLLTSFLGRNPEAVDALAEFASRLGIAVCEVAPQYLNLPGDHPCHIGYGWKEIASEADLILLVDVDVPWIPQKTALRNGVRVFHIDVDPIKEDLGFWHFPAVRSYRADSRIALGQLLAPCAAVDETARASRRSWIADAKDRYALSFPLPSDGPITSAELSAAVAELVNERTIVVFEAPSENDIILSTLRLREPGSYYASGGSSLGFGITAAIGAKLARPEAEVVTLVGDGCYQFGIPTSTYWVASTYGAPFLTVIYNNGGWNSPRRSTLMLHPEGHAQRHDAFWIASTAGTRLHEMACAAGDVAGFRVEDRADLKETLARAMREVRSGRPAVVDVAIAPVSAQKLGEQGLPEES